MVELGTRDRAVKVGGGGGGGRESAVREGVGFR